MTTYSERLAWHAMDLSEQGHDLPGGRYAIGSVIVAAETFLLQYRRLSVVGIGRRWWLFGTYRATLAGTTRTIVTDSPERVALTGTGRVVLSDLQDTASSTAGGAHPDLATHDALGLATDAELSAAVAAHAAGADPHAVYNSNPLDPGSITIATERFLLHYTRLKLASAERFTMEGTARIVVDDYSTAADTLYLGSPKKPSRSFTVPTDYFLDQLTRLTLADAMRATLEGTADLVLTDDVATRSRLVLAGRG